MSCDVVAHQRSPPRANRPGPSRAPRTWQLPFGERGCPGCALSCAGPAGRPGSRGPGKGCRPHQASAWPRAVSGPPCLGLPSCETVVVEGGGRLGLEPRAFLLPSCRVTNLAGAGPPPRCTPQGFSRLTRRLPWPPTRRLPLAASRRSSRLPTAHSPFHSTLPTCPAAPATSMRVSRGPHHSGCPRRLRTHQGTHVGAGQVWGSSSPMGDGWSPHLPRKSLGKWLPFRLSSRSSPYEPLTRVSLAAAGFGSLFLSRLPLEAWRARTEP